VEELIKNLEDSNKIGYNMQQKLTATDWQK
jgi:hypothetical protein